MPKTVALGPGTAAGLRRAAERAYPREACGFLLGAINGDDLDVWRLIESVNRAERSDRFLIDAADVFEATRQARRDGVTLLGVFHSHPDGSSRPSATDRADAAEIWANVIVACREGCAGDIGCWWWTGEHFAPLELLGGDRGAAADSGAALDREPAKREAAADREAAS